jgi:H+/Cl- antiporter ClcA
VVLPDISHDRPDDSDQDVPAVGERLAREQAIRQIGRRRRFRFWAVMGTLFMILLTVIWAFTQYHNAGGWPTNGFSQSNSGWGYPNVWNPWIIWPAIVWVLAMAGYGWFVYGNKPVSEGEIKREIERQASQRR